MIKEALKAIKLVFLMIFLAVPIIGNDSNPGLQLQRGQIIQKYLNIEAGKVYYVDNINGNDSQPGTEVLPWRTIQKAASTMVPGDKVIVKGGTYNERISQTTSGSPGNEIVFQVNSGDTVTCKGFTISGSYVTVDGFKVDADNNNEVTGVGVYVSSGYVTVKNCFATECPLGGIFFNQTSHHGYIYNNRCYHNGQNGIAVLGSYHLIENNEVWESVQHHPQAPNVGGADADGVRFHGDHHTFRGNWIHEPALMSDPYNTNPHIDAFQTFDGSAYGAPAATYCVFERNHVRHYQRTSTFMIDGNAHHLTIRNNIFEVGWGVNCCNSHDIFIYNNTFIGDLSITSGYPDAFIADDGTVSNIEIKNNISVNYKGNGNHRNLTGCTGLVVDYNCLYNTDGSYPNAVFPGPQSHELWGKDPKFVSLSNRDFHLQSTSSCINVGATISNITEDYDGNFRPQGSAYDIGAYEYNGVTPLGATANASPTSGQAPLLVSFTGSASGGTSPYTYSWNFGDGQSSASQNPTHTYQNAGNFTATLTVTDNVSATANAAVNISASLYTPLSASCSASPTSGQAPLTVNFTGSASGGTSPYTYSWNFGDSQSSSSQNPSHIYTTFGNLTATLTVTDSASATASATVNISVTASPALSASASASPTSGQAPLLVNFTGSASGGKSPYIYRWTFGDGQVSTSQNPAHTYQNSGNYTATLTVTDSASANANATVNISVSANPPISQTIIATPTSGPAPLTVNFTANASGGTPPYAYSWNFGDGQSSTEQNVSHTYVAAGTYVATLTVTDSLGATTNGSVTIIVKSNNPTDPIALFTANPSQGLLPLPVNFDASASYDPDGSITVYEWDFGDATRGSGKIVSHTFSKRGTVTVTLRVTDNTGRTGTGSRQIFVFSKPTALFTTLSLSNKLSRTVGFDASASYDSYGTISSYKWSFGDGASGSGKTLVHSFTKQGTYTVKLTVTNDQGYPGETSKTITVSGGSRRR
jgi:PKD repeat protein